MILLCSSAEIEVLWVIESSLLVKCSEDTPSKVIGYHYPPLLFSILSSLSWRHFLSRIVFIVQALSVRPQMI